MGFQEITYKKKNLTIHKAITEPRFNEKTVLAHSTWDYVELWLRRARKDAARFYWNQAHSFYDATLLLPKISAPLTAYYCILNATKALLLTKNIIITPQHGVSGYTIKKQTSLSNEKVKFKNKGILTSLCKHLGEKVNQDEYSLKDLLYNLPNIHRAFDLTYSANKELFIPISRPIIVCSKGSDDSWFCAELKGKYANKVNVNKLPPCFERDEGVQDKVIIRTKKRFKWIHQEKRKEESLCNYKRYHMQLRKHLYYINGSERMWYIKRGGNIDGYISRSTMPLIFAAMHNLSEMARYDPEKLAKHFKCQHNWLLSEFIISSTSQFIDEISSELTGYEFMMPGISR